MAKKKGMTEKEYFFRQWMCVKLGGYKFTNNETFKVPQGVSDIVREFNENNKGKREITYPTCKTYIGRLTQEVIGNGEFDLNTDTYNYGFEMSDEVVDMSASVSQGISVGSVGTQLKSEIDCLMSTLAEDVNKANGGDDDIMAVDLGSIDFGDYRFYQTDTVCDEIMSATKMGKGLTNRNIIIAVGESGVGKSTLLMDLMARMRSNPNNPQDSKYAYVSSEMMKSDLKFYLEENPIAANVPIIPLMQYVIGGKVVKAIQDIFLSDKFDVIVLDSFQDLLVKLVNYCGMKASEAQTMLINLLIASAEVYKKTIISIQHMTKGGEYVGSTLLKHSVTGMIECRFDGGDRYFHFSKNRRGGSVQKLRVYFNLNRENGEMEYDEARYNAQIEAKNISKEEQMKQRFGNLHDLLENQGVENADDDEILTTLSQIDDTVPMDVTESETIDLNESDYVIEPTNEIAE